MWKDILKESPEEAKANEAKRFVLEGKSKGMKGSEALRLFAQKFPAQTPPNYQSSIDTMQRIEELADRASQSGKKLEELEGKNQ
jgi:hypothetical protein